MAFSAGRGGKNRSDEIGLLLLVLLCHPKVDLQQLPEKSSGDGDESFPSRGGRWRSRGKPCAVFRLLTGSNLWLPFGPLPTWRQTREAKCSMEMSPRLPALHPLFPLEAEGDLRGWRSVGWVLSCLGWGVSFGGSGTWLLARSGCGGRTRAPRECNTRSGTAEGAWRWVRDPARGISGFALLWRLGGSPELLPGRDGTWG